MDFFTAMVARYRCLVMASGGVCPDGLAAFGGGGGDPVSSRLGFVGYDADPIIRVLGHALRVCLGSMAVLQQVGD